MKKLMIAALLSGQMLIGVQPAPAADFAAPQPERMGAFGGLRVRVPLGGREDQRQVRAGLTIAPTLQDSNAQGERALLIGEGVEIGYRPGRPLALSVGGVNLNRPRLGSAQDEPAPAEEEESGGGLSWPLIVGGVVIATLGIGALAINEWIDDDRCCE